MRINYLRIAIVSFFSAASISAFCTEQKPQTFCNPMNIDYQPFGEKARTAADPVIVPFNGKYYLFCSLYAGGNYVYRVSEDLVNWKSLPFPKHILDVILDKKGEAYAPGLVVIDGYIYYARLDDKNVIRTKNPEDPKSWEIFSEKTFSGFDPAYFLDDDGKLYNYYGALENSVRELKKEDFSIIRGSENQLTPKTKTPENIDALDYGLYQVKQEYENPYSDWNKPETLDTARIIRRNPPAKPQLNTVSKDSMQEAAWMTKYKGKYYLQNSNPGTACPWYSDSVWVSESPTKDFKLTDYATASMKVGGFVNSTGHSCVFQDFYGNWWRVSTMWVGVYAGFERRIGLFPAGFDDEGRMFTQTEFGDYPLLMPNKKRKDGDTLLMGWNILSKNAKVEASSTLGNFTPENASDENIRTWWSAKTSDKSEWFSMDLGEISTINALQINFAEQDIDQKAIDEDYNAYKILVSDDGKSWQILLDKSDNRTSVPHDYIQLEKPIKSRYVKIENVHGSKLGKFAIRDLRIFGSAKGSLPEFVSNVKAIRDESDPRNISIFWSPIKNVQGYMIHYGVAPDALHLSVQYQKPDAEKLTLSCFNKAAKDYYFRVDTYNKNGVSKGKVFKATQGKLDLGEAQEMRK